MQVLPTHMHNTYIIIKNSEIVLNIVKIFSVLCFSSEKLFSKNNLMFVNSACFVYIFLLEIKYTIGTLSITIVTWRVPSLALKKILIANKKRTSFSDI